MTVVTADSRRQRVYPAEFGPGSIANLDELNSVFIATTSAELSATSGTIPPLGSIALDGSRDYWASVLGGPDVQLQIMPGVTAWSPSPAEIAAQIALKGISVNVSAAAFIITPSGDTSGTKDTTALTSALGLYGAISLAPGTYYINGITVAGCQLSGAGVQTIIQPGSLWPGGAMITLQSNGSVYNLAGFGGSTTTSDNPVVGAFILVPEGQSRWSVVDVDCDHMNGLVVDVHASTGMHGRIRGIRGEHNSYGIGISNPSAVGSVTAEINGYDYDLQNCELGPALILFGVTDCGTHLANLSIIGGLAADVISAEGSLQTCQLIGVDAGGGSGAALHLAQGAGSSAPTDMIVIGKLQEATNGLLIEDGTARCQFMVQLTRNSNDGLKSTGGGADLAFTIPMFNLNTVNDAEMTSTAHVGIFGGGYITSAPSGDNLAIPASNHVTDDNPTPASRTESNAPEGW